MFACIVLYHTLVIATTMPVEYSYVNIHVDCSTRQQTDLDGLRKQVYIVCDCPDYSQPKLPKENLAFR